MLPIPFRFLSSLVTSPTQPGSPAPIRNPPITSSSPPPIRSLTPTPAGPRRMSDYYADLVTTFNRYNNLIITVQPVLGDTRMVVGDIDEHYRLRGQIRRLLTDLANLVHEKDVAFYRHRNGTAICPADHELQGWDDDDYNYDDDDTGVHNATALRCLPWSDRTAPSPPNRPPPLPSPYIDFPLQPLKSHEYFAVDLWLEKVETTARMNQWCEDRMYAEALVHATPAVQHWHRYRDTPIFPVTSPSEMDTWANFKRDLLEVLGGPDRQKAGEVALNHLTWDPAAPCRREDYFKYYSQVTLVTQRARLGPDRAKYHLVRVLPREWRDKVEATLNEADSPEVVYGRVRHIFDLYSEVPSTPTRPESPLDPDFKAFFMAVDWNRFLHGGPARDAGASSDY
ncbi:hypothetical protein IWQ60_011816 [Tieghemiomyces parasiticus]|uniref:Uncharacterized protein n=1 Tax=Tieghemiomyces parasiticus TaxID=78921 RepID=A0A9W8DLA6_9FUNG|nr:hypothetical protein IWQ60_011816 [Tieghemiomyces parasiticus]